ncbi:hypothetical protein ONE63_005087 [Megalurothrips usitatus]|uniref:Peptidoglycan recognition protein family domain-containing protein n=1 Tax=Megalurothrips usitatus TaxID=439358 RepID=A0AAV7XY92_9NEOP|nr:hypothetical protein ONE63_005087 [Megalurothrips usitatus]
MYNFLIGGDGLIYEGRGWLVAQHLYGWDSFILGVAFIGHFDDECPTLLQQAALTNFLQFGVQIGRLFDNYSVIGACALIDAPASPGPGQCFLAELRSWHNYWDDAHTNGACPALAARRPPQAAQPHGGNAGAY